MSTIVLQALCAGVLALGLSFALGVLACAMIVYSTEAQRQSLVTLVDAIRDQVPNTTRQAMDTYGAAARRDQFREWFARTPAPPWPLSDEEWRRLLEILRELREAESLDTASVDDRAVAALLAVAPDSRRVADLLEKRCSQSEARQLRMHEWIDRSGGDFRALIKGSRGWILRENMLLRWAAFKNLMFPALKGIVGDASKVGAQYATIGLIGGAVLWLLFVSGEPSDLIVYGGGGTVFGGLAGVAVALERVHREALTALVAPDPPLMRVGKVLGLAGWTLVFVGMMARNRAGLVEAEVWSFAAFVAFELAALAVLGICWIRQRRERAPEARFGGQ